MTQSLRERLTEASRRHDPFTSRSIERGWEWDCHLCGIEEIPVASPEEGDEAVHDHLAEAALAVFAEWLHQKADETRAVANTLPAHNEAEATGAARMLDVLADSIAPTEGEMP